jgi:hypothetical protein
MSDVAQRIDVHAHHLPPDYIAALCDRGIFLLGGIPIPECGSRIHAPTGDPQPALSAVFDKSRREAIDGLNARGQFERLGKPTPVA